MKIYFLRHGRCTGNELGIFNGRLDTPLTELGKEQARTAAEKIVSRYGLGYFSCIYCSDLTRTKQTVEPIALALGISLDEVIFDPDLQERCFGVLEGEEIWRFRELSEYEELGSGDFIIHKVEGGETPEQVTQRVVRVLLKLASRHNGDNLLVVSHGEIFKFLYAAYTGIPWIEIAKQPYLKNCEIFEFPQHSYALRT